MSISPRRLVGNAIRFCKQSGFIKAREASKAIMVAEYFRRKLPSCQLGAVERHDRPAKWGNPHGGAWSQAKSGSIAEALGVCSCPSKPNVCSQD